MTRDAVCGGTSVANAIGSARSDTLPSAPWTRNLYRPSAGKPGQNNSHTPVDPSTRSGASLPSQLLNSPIRLTPLAFGAHTAKDTPSTTPSAVAERPRVRAEYLPESFVATLGEQVQIDLAQGRQEPVRIGHGGPERAAIGCRVTDLEPVVDQVDERQRHREQPGVDVLQRVPLAADQCGHHLGVRTERPDDGLVAVLVRAEDRVRDRDGCRRSTGADRTGRARGTY